MGNCVIFAENDMGAVQWYHDTTYKDKILFFSKKKERQDPLPLLQFQATICTAWASPAEKLA